MFKGSKNVEPEAHTLVHLERRRPEQRLHARRRDGLLGNGAGAVSAADAVARSRPHGDAARRRRHVPARAPGRQGRAPDEGREPAVRPAVRADLQPGVHRPPLQAPDHRQHGRSRGGVDRGRARLLPHLLRADQRDADHRRRLRSRPGDADGGAVLRPHSETAERGAARHPGRAADDQGEARHARATVAASCGRRRASHHLRRQPRLVSAAHGVEDPVRRAELADLSKACLRHRAGADRLRRRQHHRASEPVLRGRHRAAGAHARGSREGADCASSIGWRPSP